MSVQDKFLSLVNEALVDIDDPRTPLSNIIRKAIRIARARNDYWNLLWLEHEMTSVQNKMARQQFARPIQMHFTKEEFGQLMIEQMHIYLEERSIQEIGVEVDEEKTGIIALAVPDIEGAIEDLSDQIQRLILFHDRSGTIS